MFVLYTGCCLQGKMGIHCKAWRFTYTTNFSLHMRVKNNNNQDMALHELVLPLCISYSVTGLCTLGSQQAKSPRKMVSLRKICPLVQVLNNTKLFYSVWPRVDLRCSPWLLLCWTGRFDQSSPLSHSVMWIWISSEWDGAFHWQIPFIYLCCESQSGRRLYKKGRPKVRLNSKDLRGFCFLEEERKMRFNTEGQKRQVIK